MAQADSKTTTIWILAIALIVVGALWLYELNKPDSIREFSGDLANLNAEIAKNCADLSTDEKRNGCINALEKLKELTAEFK